MLEATYTKPYMAHASIGPSAAVAEFKDGKFTVWTHSQGVFPLRAEIAKALKMPPAAVRCIHTEGAGCYGHNGADDVALDAALLARAVPGRPVRLQWMRDDEFAWEPYGPAMAMQAKAALDAEGRIVDWNYELWSNTPLDAPDVDQRRERARRLVSRRAAADGAADLRRRSRPAAATATRSRSTISRTRGWCTTSSRTMPIRVSALRTLGAYANVFAANPSWTSWRSRPAPTRSRSGWRT